MNLPFTPETVLIGAVIAQGFFASGVLVCKHQNRRANPFLSLLVLGFSLWLCDTFFRIANVYAQNPNYYFLPIYFSLAFGPLTYFYTQALTKRSFTFRRKDLLHFLPVVIQLSVYLYLQGQDYAYRRWFWLEVHRPYTYDFEFFLSLISLFFYLLFSIRLVRQYQHWIKNQYSEISRISLHWMTLYLSLLSSLTILWLIDALLRELLTFYSDQPFSALAMGIAVLVLAAGGILQPDLTAQGIDDAEPIPTEKPPIDNKLLNQIVHAMEKDQYFLDPDLSLKQFAQALDLPARQVSMHINQGLDQTFIDFVNHYRVEKVKKHLIQDDLYNLSLLGIALDSGFVSKSTFNRVFKKHTGKSPSEYQKSVQNRF